MCLIYLGRLTLLHIMMIGNPFLTISKAKWGYPGFLHIYPIKGHIGRIYTEASFFAPKPFSNNFPLLFPPSPYHCKESVFWF